MSISLLVDQTDYVMEGEIVPKHVAALRDTYPAQVKACFLGYNRLTPKQKLYEIRMHAGYSNDWSSSYTDANLLKIISREIAFSQYLMEACAAYQFLYFDTSDHFVQTLDEVVAYVRSV